ncbi:MAG: extracellular solute-binding protein, partial [Clostridia bacterium]|nr:extracellular solute-binding protein [Clostridia bacterium]
MTRKVVSIILVLALCFVFAGCGAENTSSEDNQSYTYTMLANKPDDWDTNWTAYFEMGSDGNPVALKGDTAPDFLANKYLARGVVQKEKDETAADDTTADDGVSSGGSKTDNGSAANNTTSKVNVKASKSTKFASDPYSDIPAALKGTTVEYLMCRQITNNDKTLIANFEKKTGIKVKLTYAEYGGYGTTVANRVAAKNSPDIIIGERVAYPNGLISLCEPLDAETFKLDDPFWDLKSMQGCKFRGKYYGVFTNKTIYHDARMMMINVPLLKQILGSDYSKKSPRALWKAGKWNLESFYDLCVKIKDKGYMPLTYISQYDFALASGQDLVKFDGTKFSSNLSNKTLQKAWGWFNEFANTTGL